MARVFDVLVAFILTGPQPLLLSIVKDEVGWFTTHICLVIVVVPHGFEAVKVTEYIPIAVY